MAFKKKQVSNLKLNDLKTKILSPNFRLLQFALVLYLFHFPGEWIWKSWVFYHSNFINFLFVSYCLTEYWFHSKENHQSNILAIIKMIFFCLLVFSLNYQWIFQTEIRFSLVTYAILQSKDILFDSVSFIALWQLVHYFPFLILLANHVTRILKSHIGFGLAILIYFLIVWTTPLQRETEGDLPRASVRNQNVNHNLDHIPENTNIVMVVLEGVSRKHILEQKSRYIDYSKLNGYHFFIPMPHTSKSLYTWMTGDPGLGSTRIESENMDLDFNLPKYLKNSHQYKTEMWYTQSIYFEGMEQFFPKIFNSVWDKTKFELEYKDQFTTFSWGMDDNVILSHLKYFPKDKFPFFLFIGLSQTHSPYFVVSKENKSPSKLVRHQNALMENTKLIDAIIGELKSKFEAETLLIITSDHGESFGEEGAQIHNYSLYNQEIDVPFLFYFLKKDELYVPNLGSSIHFKDTMVALLSKGKNKITETNKFFSDEYKLQLQCKTWNSEIQRGLIFDGKKYIFHNDVGILYEMDLDDSGRNAITNQKKKNTLLNMMFK
ncbi:sulfatase-like hydrolase/transferase [Leptospira jelokensis]|uniref:Hydrolase n=1 Tax=Leptospira jelokensis TaxID=2484931 RepID=A0A4Z0ZMV0_9LEPT|nr:sulfatase-like hydrolase/transferase [Leptospira jelokensis]TGL57723.1 hydrolase [Leptospira jelokensis]